MSFTAAAYGIFFNSGQGPYSITSFRGEIVHLYGKGLYKNDSVSAAAQMIGQDIVTLALGLPLLNIALYFSRKGSLKGRLLLTGTLGYFLYTYISYAFLAEYNPFFLVYVALMSAALFAFTLSLMSFDLGKIGSYFSPKLPTGFIGSFLLFLSVAVLLMWVSKIVPPLINGTIPFGLEHYTTLVIQAMDLGFVVPAGTLSGILFLRRHPFGYLLGSVIIMKGITMLTAITAMIIALAFAGVKIRLAEVALFPLFNVVVIYVFVLIMKHLKENEA
nr:hypothetical protein [Paenibacillus caui]